MHVVKRFLIGTALLLPLLFISPQQADAQTMPCWECVDIGFWTCEQTEPMEWGRGWCEVYWEDNKQYCEVTMGDCYIHDTEELDVLAAFTADGTRRLHRPDESRFEGGEFHDGASELVRECRGYVIHRAYLANRREEVLKRTASLSI